MSRLYKVHCEDDNSYAKPRTNCGRFTWYVWAVVGELFDLIEEKHKCILCAKKRNGDL